MLKCILPAVFVCLPLFGQVVTQSWGGGGGGGTTSVSGLTDIQGSTSGAVVSFTSGAVDVLGGARQAIAASSIANTGAAYTGSMSCYVVLGDTAVSCAVGSGAFTGTGVTVVTGTTGYPTSGQYGKIGTATYTVGVAVWASAASIHPIQKPVIAKPGGNAIVTEFSDRYEVDSTAAAAAGYAKFTWALQGAISSTPAQMGSAPSTWKSWTIDLGNGTADTGDYFGVNLPSNFDTSRSFIFHAPFLSNVLTGSPTFGVSIKCIALGTSLYFAQTYNTEVTAAVPLVAVAGDYTYVDVTVPSTGCAASQRMMVHFQRKGVGSTASNLFITEPDLMIPTT
jgi:hypothetical protein